VGESAVVKNKSTTLEGKERERRVKEAGPILGRGKRETQTGRESRECAGMELQTSLTRGRPKRGCWKEARRLGLDSRADSCASSCQTMRKA